MSDQDFLKEFGKNLGRERLHEASDADWTKLATSLDAKDRGRRRRRQVLAWAFPLVATAAFALLGAQLWQTRSQTNALQAEINRLRAEQAAQPSAFKTDTVLRHVSVIRYDTIYRTVVVRTRLHDASEPVFDSKNRRPIAGEIAPKGQNQHSASENQGETSGTILLPDALQDAQSTGADRADAPQKNSAGLSATQAPNVSARLPDTPTSQADEEKTQQAPTAAVHQPTSPEAGSSRVVLALPARLLPLRNHLKQRQPSPADLMVVLPARPALPMPLVRRLRPQSAMISITGGLQFQQTEGVEYRDNYSVGLMGQLFLGNHLRLMAGAEYSSANSKTRGSGLPTLRFSPPTPPTINDELRVVESRQPLWDFSLGLRYVFNPEKRLRPYVSAGWLGQLVQEETLRYEFLNSVTDMKTYVIAPRDNDSFNANGLQLSLGVEWALSKHLSIGTEGLFRRQASPLVPLLVGRWGLRAGLGYRF